MVTLSQTWVFWHVLAQVGLEEYRVDVSFLVHCILSIGLSVIYFCCWKVEPSDFLVFSFFFFPSMILIALMETGDSFIRCRFLRRGITGVKKDREPLHCRRLQWRFSGSFQSYFESICHCLFTRVSTSVLVHMKLIFTHVVVPPFFL